MRCAFEKLRNFARNRPLILLSSDDQFYVRIREAIADFPHAVIIERASAQADQWLDAEGATHRYNDSAIRKEWQAIRRVLESQKVAITGSPEVISEINNHAIKLQRGATSPEGTPVLMRVTYHPNWQRTDGAGVYPTTPFFMLTFVHESASVVYRRRWFDWAGLVCSATTFVLLCAFTAWPMRKRRA